MIAKAKTASKTSLAINEEMKEVERALNAKFGVGPISGGGGEGSTKSGDAISGAKTDTTSKTDISWQVVGGGVFQAQK